MADQARSGAARQETHDGSGGARLNPALTGALRSSG